MSHASVAPSDITGLSFTQLFPESSEIRNNDYIEKNIIEDDCIICLEKYHSETNEDSSSYLHLLKNNHKELIKQCKCNCKIHNICLESWLSDKNNCIICRNNFIILPIEKKINTWKYILCNKIVLRLFIFTLIFFGILYGLLKN